ncbi:TorF family putative porin [Methylotenera sp.]|uniref:TorF family putative porin n=1 Tax=Methylotenera sp. TaxID=2051956 RepID=UPI002734FD5C|nr:TorF family putative porin [Methylotenera sp.]MDP3006859.1 TorF family putative porin [Methylotenera sp.]MDP3007204.1 TorF family putative porin [Methylotenera sp.]
MNSLVWIKNRHVVSALCAAPILFSCAYASAEAAAPAAVEAVAAAPAEPAPPYTLSFNLGLYSNYMFRGVALSDGPALQGGIDWVHSSGFYLGTWFSTIDPDYAVGNHQEVDLYGGYAYTFENGLGVNFMGNYYWYPENRKADGKSIDSFEVSAAISYKLLTYTYL